MRKTNKQSHNLRVDAHRLPSGPVLPVCVLLAACQYIAYCLSEYCLPPVSTLLIACLRIACRLSVAVLLPAVAVVPADTGRLTLPENANPKAWKLSLPALEIPFPSPSAPTQKVPTVFCIACRLLYIAAIFIYRRHFNMF